jgi:hypothetical protein
MCRFFDDEEVRKLAELALYALESGIHCDADSIENESIYPKLKYYWGIS